MDKSELRAFRKKHQYSRQAFAEAIGISVHTLDAWEQGRRNIPKTKVSLINALINNKEAKVIKLGSEGTIEIQKIVDIVIDNYTKFQENEDFKSILDKYALESLEDYLAQKRAK